eukprot:CCRYP_016834-RA/>CCRYP_016834-RA protein AED:0.01 eAED:0.01 QI:617/1/1/1/0.5/0.66/3/536/1016
MAFKEDAENAIAERPPSKPHDCVDNSLPQNDYSGVKPSGVKRLREKLVESVEVVSFKRARPTTSTLESEAINVSPDRSSRSEKLPNGVSKSLTKPETPPPSKNQTEIMPSSPVQHDILQTLHTDFDVSDSLRPPNEELDRQSDSEHCPNPTTLSTLETSEHEHPSSPAHNNFVDGNQVIDETESVTHQTPMEPAEQIIAVTSTESCRQKKYDEQESDNIRSDAKETISLHSCLDNRVVVEQGRFINLPSSSENANDLQVEEEMKSSRVLNLKPVEKKQITQGDIALDETLNIQSDDDNKVELVDDDPIDIEASTGDGNIVSAEGVCVHDEREQNETSDIYDVEVTTENASPGDAHHSTSKSNSKLNGSDAEHATDEVLLGNVERVVAKPKESYDSAFLPTKANKLTECTATIFLGDSDMKVQYNEDPSVESYSILESGGSVKSFVMETIGAASGAETNASVPQSVNGSFNLRTLSSFSAGESSQNLSLLVGDEKNFSEPDEVKNTGDTLLPSVEINDLATKLENESMLDPSKMSRQDDKEKLQSSNVNFLSKDVHDRIETNQLPMGPETCYPRAYDQRNGSPKSGDGRKDFDGVHIEFPQINVHKQTPSVSQLKTALFLESRRVHRDVGAERDFANYWKTLQRYITLNPHASEMNTSRHGIDSTLTLFLKTKKLKRLHNKLVLALLSEAMREHVSACLVSRYVPDAWKGKTSIQSTFRTSLGQEKSEADCNDMASDFKQWRTLLGKDSGAWTTYGTELVRSKLCTESKANLCTSNTPQRYNAENDSIPTASIPASLQIDPLVRQYVSNAGMRVSENAIWMIVVAAREHLTSVIKKTLANTRGLEQGLLPQIPKSKMITLACQRMEAQPGPLDNEDGNDSGETSYIKKRLIGAAELTHMLASDPVIAGGIASSRMSLMRSALSDGKYLSHGRLSQVCHIINTSIQQAEAHKNATNMTDAFESHYYSPLPTFALQPRNKKDFCDSVSQSSVHSKLAADSEMVKDNTKEMSDQSSASLP